MNCIKERKKQKQNNIYYRPDKTLSSSLMELKNFHEPSTKWTHNAQFILAQTNLTLLILATML